MPRVLIKEHCKGTEVHLKPSGETIEAIKNVISPLAI